MAKKLSEYYGSNKVAGNRRLSSYYGDRNQGFTSARQIAAAFSAQITEYPRYFRRSFIAEKLRFSYDRELALLSDALQVLETGGLIRFDRDKNQWENLQRN